jgi:8-oxo-dGTP pyrophosphatase MutT (NUDIX family)
VLDSSVAAGAYPPPRIPASAGALIVDPDGRLLILKPTYKKGWTIPGGQIDDTGESPWAACRRETHEECGLILRRGRLACVDFLFPRAGRAGGVRFLFDCGTLPAAELAGIRLQASEIAEYRLAAIGEALELLRGPIRRRVSHSLGRSSCAYLEEGRPVEAVA